MMYIRTEYVSYTQIGVFQVISYDTLSYEWSMICIIVRVRTYECLKSVFLPYHTTFGETFILKGFFGSVSSYSIIIVLHIL